MVFYKLTTSDEETRWINLDQVLRVTLATEPSGKKPVLVILFPETSSEHETKLTIVGNTQENRATIEDLTKRLDELSAGST